MLLKVNIVWERNASETLPRQVFMPENTVVSDRATLSDTLSEWITGTFKAVPEYITVEHVGPSPVTLRCRNCAFVFGSSLCRERHGKMYDYFCAEGSRIYAEGNAALVADCSRGKYPLKGAS